MARERYLVGVDPEELKPTPPPEPEHRTGFLENLWYHYKWHIIIIAFVLVLVAIGVYQLVSRDDPDYTMVVLTADPLTTDTVEQLQEQLAAVGTDMDEDGKVEVLIENLALGIPYSNQKIANENTLVAHFAAGDVLLYAAEPDYYESRIQAKAGDYEFFTTLQSGEPYVEWYPAIDGVDGPLYLGVRNASGTAEANDTHAACVDLVEQFAKSLANTAK